MKLSMAHPRDLIEKGKKYDKLLSTCARQVDEIIKLKESHDRLKELTRLNIEFFEEVKPYGEFIPETKKMIEDSKTILKLSL